MIMADKIEHLDGEVEEGYYEWSVQKIQDAIAYNRKHADKSMTYEEVRAHFGLDE
jgi:hypothetical protein